MRFFIYFSYNGANYSGWQNQPNAITVQEQLEKDISLLLRKETDVIGAGRTDAGVHAKLMVAHFDADINTAEAAGLVPRLNGLLPKDISIHRIVPVVEGTNARFAATARTYKYFITSTKDPFIGELMLKTHLKLNFEKMNEAAKIMLEYDDFECFSKVRTDVKTFICHIREAYWAPHPYITDCHVFTITADRFLRNMVRAIVGTLFEIGREKKEPKDMHTIIASKDRGMAGSSAPANGLYLWNVEYPYEIFI
ncbi:tRNA pseudouridine(38-40) synthase TruA [Falsiporphyromonas endometrii]|uniref:tRNA pseudouridine synthase A n=1 Tax=Falsiporphyromonas endometrii TaxID=1387297 RepID=A0ABV9K7N1_9PORP